MVKKRTFLVTGLSSLLGIELAKELLQNENHTIIGFSRSVDYLNEFSIEEQERIKAFSVDLSNIEIFLNFFEEFLLTTDFIITDFIHLSGVASFKKIKATKYDDALRDFNINFFSATVIISKLLQKKYKQELSNIVFLSSVSVLKGTPGYSIYASSKASLHSYMKTLAVELKGKVKINTVIAGGFRSKSNKEIYDSGILSDKGYLLDHGQTSDIVNAIKYFINDDSKWIMGQTLIVDGGYTI